MQHLCSRTLRPSLTESFVDAWTSSLEDSRVSHSQLLESVKQLKTQDTSSPTSQTESESANLELCFSKTWQESSLLRLETEIPFSNMSSKNWKDWVIEQRQEYSQRKKSAHLTRESESSSWPTPTIAEVSGGMRLDQIKSGKWHNIQLREKIALLEEEKQDNWATPNVCGNHNRKGVSKTSGDGLSTQVKNWATPQSRDYKGARRKLSEDGKNRSQTTGETFGKDLNQQVKNWPTATTRDWKDTNSTVPPSRANPSKQTLGQRVAHVGLQDQANLNTNGKSQESWPTPRANKVHPEITEENREHLANRNKANLEEDIAGHCGKATGKLNPNWVEHLMGLTVGWTDLGSWETE